MQKIEIKIDTCTCNMITVVSQNITLLMNVFVHPYKVQFCQMNSAFIQVLFIQNFTPYLQIDIRCMLMNDNILIYIVCEERTTTVHKANFSLQQD